MFDVHYLLYVNLYLTKVFEKTNYQLKKMKLQMYKGGHLVGKCTKCK